MASVGIAPCKVVAKVASDLSKPDGLIEVLPGQEKNFLAPLAVQKLPGVGDKTAKILKSAGIETIGQLAEMPLELFRSRYGEGMLWLREHARGIDTVRLKRAVRQSLSAGRQPSKKTPWILAS